MPDVLDSLRPTPEMRERSLRELAEQLRGAPGVRACTPEELARPGMDDLLFRMCRENLPSLKSEPARPGTGRLIPLAPGAQG